jgi:hypothetical protein
MTTNKALILRTGPTMEDHHDRTGSQDQRKRWRVRPA